jgi:cobalt-zinc-cadmium resistance protein CzcA
LLITRFKSIPIAGQYEANIKVHTFEKTNIYYNYDENNLASNNKQLNVLAQQRFSFPTVYGAQKKVYETSMKRKASYEKKAICH